MIKRLKGGEIFLVYFLIFWFCGWFGEFRNISWWIILFCLFSSCFLLKRKLIFFILFLFILIIINLNLNRLLNFTFNPFTVSFDKEQSFLGYQLINKSIQRYSLEGLWLPFKLRPYFYGSYLKFFSWFIGLSRYLSIVFWIKTVGFGGFYLMLSGLINYFKNKKRNNLLVVWFFVVLVSSTLRIMGDTYKFVFLGLPVAFYWIYLGFENPIFRKKRWLIYVLLILDFCLK